MSCVRHGVGACAVFVGLFLVPRVCEAADVRIELGLRSGYAVPMGKVSDDGSDLAEMISGQVPLWLDLGVRLRGQTFFGAFGQYGFGFVGSDVADVCEDAEQLDPSVEADCSVRVVRAGVQFQYSFVKPTAKAQPWIGASFSYEWIDWSAKISSPVESAEIDASRRGLEIFGFQGGLDIRVSDAFALGPYFVFTTGQYDTASVTCTGSCGDSAGTTE